MFVWAEISDLNAPRDPYRRHWHRGPLRTGKTITIESLIGTRFDVRVVETTTVGGCPTVIPEVTGYAYITGRHEFLIDPEDPLKDGVLLR